MCGNFCTPPPKSKMPRSHHLVSHTRRPPPIHVRTKKPASALALKGRGETRATRGFWPSFLFLSYPFIPFQAAPMSPSTHPSIHPFTGGVGIFGDRPSMLVCRPTYVRNHHHHHPYHAAMLPRNGGGTWMGWGRAANTTQRAMACVPPPARPQLTGAWWLRARVGSQGSLGLPVEWLDCWYPTRRPHYARMLGWLVVVVVVRRRGLF